MVMALHDVGDGGVRCKPVHRVDDVRAVDWRERRFEDYESVVVVPYKGDTQYWTLAGDHPVEDVAWSYPAPFDESLPRHRPLAVRWR